MKKLEFVGAATAVGMVVMVVCSMVAPALPPDGTERHSWHITAYTPSNTVWVSDGVPQDFTHNTAYPRRNFGSNAIRRHWFSKPSIHVVDDNGIRWEGVMID